MKRTVAFLLSLLMAFTLTGCGQRPGNMTGKNIDRSDEAMETTESSVEKETVNKEDGSGEAIMEIPENFVKIQGGTFQMGSPENEAWRSEDETRHTVTVSDFYMSRYEVTQAEWEYACRAGTDTPFYMENSPSAQEANYYGHYPYMIEENYFSQDNLVVQPGEYRQTTVAVGSFAANPFGLYDMHGNVGEWTWDIYGEYPLETQTDPAGPVNGFRRVYRGGGWNDFAKNMRCAYRAMMDQDKSSFNVGIRLVRNAVAGTGNVEGTDMEHNSEKTAGSKVLIAYFSWGGNTRGIAQEIAEQTGAELFEITLVHPYSDNYNTVLDEAQRDQNEQARPELASHVENMDEYDTIILGYPNWWASIPMPVASFLEEYDFSGKTIIPFCSHGGGRFGQSLTAIAKLAPDAVMGDALSVHYSGGSSLSEDVRQWLSENGIEQK